MGKIKISAGDREEIKELYASGMSIAALANKYHVSYVTIKRVLNPDLYEEHLRQVSNYNKKNASEINRRQKEKTRRFSFTLNQEADTQVISILNGKENLTQYIRDLVLADMKSNKRNM